MDMYLFYQFFLEKSVHCKTHFRTVFCYLFSSKSFIQNKINLRFKPLKNYKTFYVLVKYVGFIKNKHIIQDYDYSLETRQKVKRYKLIHLFSSFWSVWE